METNKSLLLNGNQENQERYQFKPTCPSFRDIGERGVFFCT
jgi:hypothetical protein